MLHDTDTADTTNQFYQDEEIDAFLSLNNSVVKLAAAQALESLAADQAMTLKVIRVLDLTTDGAKLAAELREQAKALRSQHESAEGDYDGLFDWAEYAIDPFSTREHVTAEALRDAS